MNNRILELADKAVDEYPGNWTIPDEYCEAFAKLIMQECVNVLVFKGLWNANISHALNEHFGIYD